MRKWIAAIAVSVCVLLIFSMNIALNLRQTAPYTTAESWLNYGESGLVETADYLALRIGSQTPCMLRKDLVYYLDRRHGIVLQKNQDPIYLFRDGWLPGLLIDFMKGPQPDYVVMDSVVVTSNPLLVRVGQQVLGHYKIDKKFGNFIILHHPSVS